MTDFSVISVSLTKHGASKIAEVLLRYPFTEALDHLDGDIEGIHINYAQAYKNLSIEHIDPENNIWIDAKEISPEALRKLVFFGIVFSHHKTIEAMMVAEKGDLKGTIKRDEVLVDKEYTNFAFIIEDLGLMTEKSYNHISYDLSPIIHIPNFDSLTKRLLYIKLKQAGWQGEKELTDELIINDLNKVFSLSPGDFINWLEGSFEFVPTEDDIEVDDIVESEGREFQFSASDNLSSRESTTRRGSSRQIKVDLLHNRIQSKLYSFLVSQYGEDNVGIENDVGYGGLVDVVLRQPDGYTFFEIKTAKSARACIRQAISQLLEYSYYPDNNRSEKLIVVAVNEPNDQIITYLSNLRRLFSIPIYYRRFNLETDQLEEPV